MKPSPSENDPNPCLYCGFDLRRAFASQSRTILCPNCGQLVRRPQSLTEICEFVARDAVVPNLSARTKAEAIELLVRKLADRGHVPFDAADEIIAAVMARESLGSTAIGDGIAVPHAKHPAVRRLVGAVGFLPHGIDFNSPDAMPVRTVFLFVSPPNAPGESLHALEQISQYLRNQAEPSQ
jgi:PTS system fructose-specific IIA component/PTS system nitrogen regulatory IIA component